MITPFTGKITIWQPMATAPRDGDIVDLWLKGGGRMTDQWWDEEDQSWTGIEEEAFSHWAPLPRFPIEANHAPGGKWWLGLLVLALMALGAATLWRTFS